MKLVLIFFFFLPSMLLAQQTITGTVVDESNGKPLQFVTVAVVNLPYGTLTDENGSFRLAIPQENLTEAQISFSFLGYTTQTFPYAALRPVGTVALSSKGVLLPVAQISAADAPDLDELTFGRFEKKAFTFYQSIYGKTYQLATLIRNPNQRTGIITELQYFFGQAAKRGKQVRFNFFDVDPSCACPGAPINATSIIPERTKTRWNKLNLRPYLVALPPADFFIALEWLGSEQEEAIKLNFSVGIVPSAVSPVVFEKLGGNAWSTKNLRGYAPLIRVQSLVE